MAEAEREPQPVLPVLKAFYDAVIPLAWPLVRIAVGWDLIVHAGARPARAGAGRPRCFARRRNFGVEFAIFLTFIEFVGGICIASACSPAFFAAAIAIEMGYLTFHHYWATFLLAQPRYEYTLLWGMVTLAIALRGGGRGRSIAMSGGSFDHALQQNKQISREVNMTNHRGLRRAA